MKKYSSKIRSLLFGGGKAIAITSVLIAVASCSHDKTDTDNLSSTTEVIATCAMTTSSSSTTTTVSTTTTTTTTTTVLVSTVLIKQAETTTTTEYVEPIAEPVYSLPITERERVLLCNVVANEYGSDWVSVYDKACIVATVMNRVNSSQFPNDIESVLTQPYQFSGYWASDSYYSTVTDSCIEAVDYYFAHSDEFGSYMYFEGDGSRNYFH